MTADLMTLDEMRKHEWIVTWSGGKDSTSTILLMHEHGIPIKRIIYVQMMFDENTPATLPAMYEHVMRAKSKFESWGYSVEIIRGITTAIEMARKQYQHSKFTERNGKYYGISAFVRGMCRFMNVKPETIRKKCHTKGEYHMIGYSADETARIQRLGGKNQSILVALGVTAAEAVKICRDNDLLSPIYNSKIRRDGCFFCPNAGKDERMRLRTDYPELYQRIQSLIEMSASGYNLRHIYTRNEWVRDYLNEQNEHSKQVTLFDGFSAQKGDIMR